MKLVHLHIICKIEAEILKTYNKRVYWKDYYLDPSEQEQAMLRYSDYLIKIEEYELARMFKDISRDYSENMYPMTNQFKYHD